MQSQLPVCDDKALEIRRVSSIKNQILMWACGLWMVFVFQGHASAGEQVLPGTKLLKWNETTLPDRLMDGAHRFIERKIEAAASYRRQYWPGENAGADVWKKAIEENRDHLRTLIGAVEERLPSEMEYFGNTAEGVVVYASDDFRVTQVRWPVVDDVFGEGLLITPKAAAVASTILIPDADQTPEQLLGMIKGGATDPLAVRQLIANNVKVLIPTLVSRAKFGFDNPRLKRADQTNREWIYRQAFQMGRHIIGYEVLKVQSAIDWLEAQQKLQAAETPIGVAGYGEGALIAFYASAIDTRIDVTLVSGYFDSREAVWSEPIYRNIWSLLKRFGDAEIASLILPRKLIIEHSESPTITGHKGDWKTPPLNRVKQEVARIRLPAGTARPTLIQGKPGTTTKPFSTGAMQVFQDELGVQQTKQPVAPLTDQRIAFQSDKRQQRTVEQIEDHVQELVRKSVTVRDKFMLYELMPEFKNQRWGTQKSLPVHDPKKFIEGSKEFRRRFYQDAIGQFDQPFLPPNARTRIVKETDKWIAYDVVLDVFDDLIAWGVLVVPKDLKPGEKRPVVVCQHGRNGIPRDTIDTQKTAYSDFAAKLAERGFITFSPHNLYRGEDRYRWLDRKANTVGCSLFSFIVAQHDQILRWLDSLPFVDGDRIAFYGLSYGGETAVRVPTILEKYCLSICSGDFNQWTRKIASTEHPFSFMWSIEWEMPYWNLGHTFDYAEMTYLMLPRPFMVERGHHDRVGLDEWVAHEFARVRWLYAQFGLADRVDIEFFQGGHSIRGQGSFAFLHKHLNWPEPTEQTKSE
ncbi:hypothetical protein [uncultured Gimesia sp.]|uniref:alpha/beta hydrolase family protein n=1 Tax=uncultured Gimesia sp. TaxID=1678688 RepID=UPI00261E55BA|nr:hypothetical protein [uncultured Gimesia sp.]